ncbi:MAG: hypothetical protein GY925_23345 [Actinomycetia bacterium]|nr:hypothetical protein [Actinomycetes bacterium]
MTTRIHRLDLGHVMLPDSHPRSSDKTCPIFSYAVDVPDGIVVVDTGPRTGHPLIDELYSPVVVSVIDALHNKAEFYTVPEWAHIETQRLRISADREEVAAGIRLLHTPGHQSVAVNTSEGLALIVGQACYTCAEFSAGEPAETDMHDPDWWTVGRDSATRLRDLGADIALFSHDPTVHQRT